MTPEAQLVTDALVWGTLLIQLVIVVLIVALFLERPGKKTCASLVIARRFALWIGFLVAFSGSGLTLVYSEVFGFAPCGLCWLQRVFLYPQVILLGMALFKRDRGIVDYVIGLSIPGLLFALYQHFIQMGGASFLPCPATPGAADCAQRIIFEFGYITFPLMAATIFGLLIVLALVLKRTPMATNV